MKRMVSRKSHSWWWDSHVSPKNSKWLAENLEEMDKQVKAMLKLIEEEADSFAKKAEIYYAKRPQLIAHVEGFYRMYRGLAERYDHLTGELRKNIPSELQSPGSGNGSDLGSEPPSPSKLTSPELTPERKVLRTKSMKRAAGFDFFLGSGGSPDVSRRGSERSSSPSESELESESESDDAGETNGDGISSMLRQRVIELESELRDAKEKLRLQKENICNSQCEHVENGDHLDLSFRVSALEEELSASNEKLRISESEILNLQKKLEETTASLETGNIQLNLEKKQVSELKERIVVLGAEILDRKHEIEDLKEAMAAARKQFESDLSHRGHEIEEYKTELENASDRFLLEKSTLEADIVERDGVSRELKAEVDKVLQEKLLLENQTAELKNVIKEFEIKAASSSEKFLNEKSALEAEVHNLSESNTSLGPKLIALEDQIKQLVSEKAGACLASEKHIIELNQNIHALNLKLENLTSEREELGAKVSVLVNDLKCRDDRIRQMDGHLNQLHLEHAKLIMEIEEARRAGMELSKLVKELEEEVDQQKVAISDGAEGKREAIRQLCFSLEHYRDGYHQLQQLLQGHRRLGNGILNSLFWVA